jgi:bifunctional DNase/RNase
MKTARFLPAQIWTIAQAEAGNAVYIRPEGLDVALPVYVYENDIQAILVELTHVLAPHPMMHELLLSAISALQAKLDHVEIYGFRNGVYLCRVVLVHNGKEIRLESRPADILCLAARLECPVHIDDEIVAKNGIPVDKITLHAESSRKPDEALPITDILQKELLAAVDREDYERAAVIRDQLSGLSKSRSDLA